MYSKLSTNEGEAPLKQKILSTDTSRVVFESTFFGSALLNFLLFSISDSFPMHSDVNRDFSWTPATEKGHVSHLYLHSTSFDLWFVSLQHYKEGEHRLSQCW